MKMHRITSAILILAICLTGVFALNGCEKGETGGYKKNKGLDTSKPVELTLASSKETWPEMDSVIAKFEEVYPNCTIVCEYIEEYTNNLPLRLSQTEKKIDIFRTANIQEGTAYKDYALNLISEESKKILDLSGANAGIVDNFRYTSAENTQYAIPFGGEMRGMYVNKTLLSKFDLKIPTNREELLNCCKVLHDEGYIPFQSAVGTFAQQLLYPLYLQQRCKRR